MTITSFVSIFILALTVEALVEYGKILFNTIQGKLVINWKQFAAIGVAVFLAIAANVDLYSVLGMTFVFPYVGVILTGIIFSRGANYLADFIKLLEAKISVQEVTKEAIEKK